MSTSLGIGLGISHNASRAGFGPELVANGDFVTDVSSWTAYQFDTDFTAGTAPFEQMSVHSSSHAGDPSINIWN